MGSTTAALHPPTKAQIAKAIAGAMPSELSKSPLIGILGVVMGAGIVTLTGRMLTLGLADLKGSLGIGFDEGAWIGAVYNVALMFIGPLTVYIGGLLGARRVLLVSAALFSIICALLPFIHSYSLLLTALALAGMTSGTFYPLTLTFALKNIPPRFLPFTLALYATFVDGAVNIAPSLFGWYREHLTFQWMFWNSTVITAVMAVCIFYGIPRTPAPKRSGAPPSFAGFLYLSAGFALLFAALDQGQRLDWWRSGLFNGLFAGGVLFLLCALARRLRSPNPLVDLPYLRLWNTQVLAFCLMLFRFCLLATIILIPQSLGIHGFEAYQFAPAVFWTAAPQLLIAVVAALMLLRGFDSRLLMATGFVCMALAAVLNAEYTSAWSAANYYRSELLMGVGQSFAFIGLVSTIVLQAVFTGGLSKPQAALTFSAFFHTIRLLGGQVGVAFMTHFVAVRERVHSNLLGLHVQQGDWIDDAAIGQLAAGLYAKSTGIGAATGRAVGLVGARIRLQAYSLSFIDGFHLIAWACVAGLLLIALLRKSPMNYGELAYPAEEAPASTGGKP
jgi:MFS transporter, DHA2 family, multidrug resistance protein